MLYAMIALCGVLSFLAVMSTYYPLRWAAGFSWWGFLTYWLTSSAVARGTPTDIIVTLVLIFVGLLFLLWGMAGRKGTFDIEEEISSTGSLVRRIIRSTKQGRNNESPQGGESLLDYRNKVRKAARGNKVSRRR